MQMVKFKLSGELQISSLAFREWVVKKPTIKNRLDRKGTTGLKWSEKYDLKIKKGIMYIDRLHYVLIPNEILAKYETSFGEVSGIKKALTVYPILQIIAENNLELIPITRIEKTV